MNIVSHVTSFCRRLWAALPDVNAWALPPGPDPVPRLQRTVSPSDVPRSALQINAAVRHRRRVFLHGKVVDLETK